MDGGIEEVFGTHQVSQYQALGQFFGYFFSQLVYFLDDFVGVGAGRLRNHAGSSRMAVYLAVVGIALCPQFHFGDIF